MATATMACGERRFGAAYTARILVVLGVLGVLAGLWASQDDTHTTAHPTLLWISIAVGFAAIILWLALGKSALVVSDSGVRRESLFGHQEITWSQVAETRYQVVPINVYAHFGLIGALIALSSKKSGRAHLILELIGQDRKKLKATSNYRNADEAIGIILSRLLPPDGAQREKQNTTRRDGPVRQRWTLSNGCYVEGNAHPDVGNHQCRTGR